MGRRLLLARHCQSEFNAAGLLTGWANPDLTAEGKSDAYRLGLTLRNLDEPVSVVFASSLKRASETARIACSAMKRDDVPVFETEKLWERSVGTMTGLSKADVYESPVSNSHSWRTCFFSAPPGGESLAQVSQRAIPYIFNSVVPVLSLKGSALIVTHHNTIKAIMIAMSRSSLPDKINNGSVVELCIDSGMVRYVSPSMSCAHAA